MNRIRNNIILIGLPTSGKSTVGVILAKLLGMDFLDTDLVIQKQTGKKLSEIIAEDGTERFLEIENEVCSGINVTDTVIATGGSAVYGEEAMEHFREIGTIVYLKIDYETLETRLHHAKQRGVVLKDNQTKKDLYEERIVLYERYADISFPEEGKSIEDAVQELSALLYERIQPAD